MKIVFGEIRFDSDTRQLWRGSKEEHLSLKAFELLKVLLERRPDAISKAELQQHLWPDTFVSEANLPGLVAEIRESIGDDARAPKYIRTLHGFGYAFAGTAAEDRPKVQATVPDRPPHWLAGEYGRLPLVAGVNVIGREGEGIIAVDDPTVSRRHARITIDERGATVEDLGSKNGTYVRDSQVTAVTRLADGDRIRFGSVLLTFRRPAFGARTQTLLSLAKSRSS